MLPDMNDSAFLQRLLLAAPVILFSLTVHEFFHGWLAYRFGDPTAKEQGRLTLNPLKHLELFGVIVMIATQFRFGWAKPVPVNPMNLRNPRTNEIFISAAGPLSNVGLAVIAGILFRTIGALSGNPSAVIDTLLQNFVFINLALAFFNLIPLFPLDGSHILRNLVPERHESTLDLIDRFSPFILLLLVVTGSLWFIIGPPVIALSRLLLGY
jgi:Zn-dependent protease